MRRLVHVVAAALLLVAVARPAAGQQADPLAGALAAYRELDFDGAASRFRSLLAPDAPRLPDADRRRALMYLGATETFRERRAEALAAFGLLIVADPRYRPDELEFPPEVTALFQEARLGVRAVAVVLPDSAEIAGPADRLPVRLYASSLHDVRLVVLDPDGAPLRLLHEGPVGDSLEVLWNGRDTGGRLHATGAYLLRATSRNATGVSVRTVEIPLTLVRITRDTLAAPSPPTAQMRPETRAPQGGARPLLVAIGAAAAVVALPSVAGSGVDAMPTRFVVSAAVGAAGIGGFLARSRPVPIPENVAFNRRLMQQHEQELERVREENAQRLAATRLRIRAGAPRVADVP